MSFSFFLRENPRVTGVLEVTIAPQLASQRHLCRPNVIYLANGQLILTSNLGDKFSDEAICIQHLASIVHFLHEIEEYGRSSAGNGYDPTRP